MNRSSSSSLELSLLFLHQLLLPVAGYVDSDDLDAVVSDTQLLHKYLLLGLSNQHQQGSSSSSTSRSASQSAASVVPTTVKSTTAASNRKNTTAQQQQQHAAVPIDPATIERVDRVLSKISPDLFKKRMTLREIIGADVAGYVPISGAEYDALIPLCSRASVSSDDVQAALLAEDATDAADTAAVCDALFHFADPLPGETLRQLLLSMIQPPKRVRHVHKFAEAMVMSQWKLLTFAPYLAFFIVTLVVISQMQWWNEHTFWRAQNWPLVDDWSNFCTGGATGSCQFLKRTSPEGVGTEAEALQWMRQEMTKQLWGWHGSTGAGDLPYAGSWLTGSLFLRTSIQTDFNLLRPHLQSPCKQYNLTENVGEIMIGQTFGCDTMYTYQIPFSDDVLTAIGTLNVAWFIVITETADAVAALQYGLFNPLSGSMAWVTGQVAIPRAGSHTFRAKVRVSNTDTYTHIKPLLIFQIVLTSFAVIGGVVYYFLVGSFGAGSPFYVFLQVLQLILISVSYGLLVDLPVLQDLYQVSHVVRGFDTLAARYDVAMGLFGFWVLLFLLQIIVYLTEFDGVSLVFSLLRLAGPDVLGLVVVFAILFLGFCQMAMIFFGATEATYSHAFLAIADLISYLFGVVDYNSQTWNFPILGVVFHYTYRVFIFFVFLNLLVAALTSPLGAAKEEANLHLEVIDALKKRLPVKNRATGDTITSLSWALYSYSATFASLLLDMFSPLTRSFPFWISKYRALKSLFRVEVDSSLAELLVACETIQALAEEAAASEAENPYSTLYLATAEQVDAVPHPTTRMLIKTLICAESGTNIVRDGRLMKALKAYDMSATRFEKQKSHFEEQMETRMSNLESAVALSPRLKHHIENKKKTNSKQDGAAEDGPSNIAVVEDLRKQQQRPPSSSPSSDDNNNLSDLFVTVYEDEPSAAGGRAQVPSSSSRSRRTAPPPPPTSSSFYFAQHVLVKIRRQLFYPLYTILVLIVYVLFSNDVLSSRQFVAYMTNNLHSALRDFPYAQNCDDVFCSSGFTHMKNSQDNGHINDLYQFMDKLYKPQLFPTTPSDFYNTYYALDPQSSPVTWNSYMRRLGNITVRQLRAKQVPCKMPPLPTGRAMTPEELAQKNRMEQLKCYSNDEFTKTFERPADGSSLYPESAYEYKEDCVEKMKLQVIGNHRDYPCEGFTASFNTSAELAYAKTYIDNATRFVAISATFNLDVVFTAQYTFYGELSEHGGTAFFWTRSDPLLDEQALHKYAPGGYVLLGLAVVRALIALLLEKGFGIHFVGKGKVPLFEMCLAILLLVLGIAGPNLFWQQTLDAGIIAMYLSIELLNAVLFPIAELFSRRATAIFNTIGMAGSVCLQVLPLFFTVFAAFMFSAHVLFGRVGLYSFSSMRVAASTIGRGFLGEWDLQELFKEDAVLALIFTGLFTLFVIITLANLVLSLVNGAAEESTRIANLHSVADSVASSRGYWIISGPLFECYLAWHLRRQGDGGGSSSSAAAAGNDGDEDDDDDDAGSGSDDAILCVENARTLTPLECLAPFMGARRASSVLRAIGYSTVPKWLRPSVVSFLLGEADEFRRSCPALFSYDECVEACGLPPVSSS